MFRRLIPSLLGAAVLVLPVPAGAATTIDNGSPIDDQGSNYHYRSFITSVTPNVPGLGLEILEFADRLLLTNHTGQTVTVYGYQGEPYARVLADGTAERNIRSPATYLNESFYGNIEVPTIADPGAPPQWEVIDRTGQFEWHDHRIHWPSPTLPPEVKDQSQRTLIFDWRVPIQVGTRMGAIEGQLFWTPETSRAPTAVIVLGVAIVVFGVAFVLFVRRRRRRVTPPAPARGVGMSAADDPEAGGYVPTGSSEHEIPARDPGKEAW
jgi:hypothetical protein